MNIKILSKKIWREIDRSSNILLHLHPGPDGDCVGSALALYHSLKSLGKNVTIIGGDSEFPRNLSTLPGADKIIPKNFFQTDLSKFDLFIILDSSSPHQISRNGKITFPKNLKTIIIDHHLSSEKFAKINLVLPKYSSTSQIVYELLQLKKIKISKNAAACLFAGIYTDTGGFKYFNPNYKTFEVASNLAKIYPKFAQLIFDIENNCSPEHLQFIGLALNSIERHFLDRVVFSSVSYEDIQKNELTSESINNSSEVTNMLKSVTGWEIAATFIEFQPNITKVNFRTRDSLNYDLSKIAVATGAGGGHRAAAGATIQKNLPDSKEFILKIIKKIYPKIDKK